MGRRKFRFSDMMPNSWFYKLRDMRRSGAGGAGAMHQTSSSSSSSLRAKGNTQLAGTPRPVPAPLPHRSSYYYASKDRVLQPSQAPHPTRTAAEDHHRVVPQTQSPSRSYGRRHKVGPARKATAPVEPEEPPHAHHHRRRDTLIGRDGGGDVGELRRPAVKDPSSTKDVFAGKVIASDTDTIFDLYTDDMHERARALRPIVTKPVKNGEADDRYELNERHVVRHAAATVAPRASSAASEQQGIKGGSRRSSVSSSGRRLKTRAISPRLAASRRRKSKSTNTASTPAAPSQRKATPAHVPPLEDSFAVVKASVDPRKDFRESMEEMIAEKGIRDAGDLEDLLACYLALNDVEHHDLIVEVFEEIWASLVINL